MSAEIYIKTLIVSCNVILYLLWSFYNKVEKISLIFTGTWDGVKSTHPKYCWELTLLLLGNKTIEAPRILKDLLQFDYRILMILFCTFPSSLSWVNYCPLYRVSQYFFYFALMMSRSSIIIWIKYYCNMCISIKSLRNFFVIIIDLPSFYLKVKIFE